MSGQCHRCPTLCHKRLPSWAPTRPISPAKTWAQISSTALWIRAEKQDPQRPSPSCLQSRGLTLQLVHGRCCLTGKRATALSCNGSRSRCRQSKVDPYETRSGWKCKDCRTGLRTPSDPTKPAAALHTRHPVGVAPRRPGAMVGWVAWRKTWIG